MFYKHCKDCRNRIRKYVFNEVLNKLVSNTEIRCKDCLKLGPPKPKYCKNKRYCRQCKIRLDNTRYFNCDKCVVLDADEGDLIFFQESAYGLGALAYRKHSYRKHEKPNLL